MSALNPFVAEIIITPFYFSPKGFAFCNGQLMYISQNTALFSLLGTTYGGDGKTTFGLPNLMGRVPIGAGQGQGLSLYDLGEIGGLEQVTLTNAQLPPHIHTIKTRELSFPAGAANNSYNPLGNYMGAAASTPLYATSAGSGSIPVKANIQAAPFHPANDPVNNMQPYLTLNFSISLQGVFPARQ